MGHDELTTQAMTGDPVDREGRSTAARIADIRPTSDHITTQQRDDARRLLNALLQAAAPFGMTLGDFDWVIDLPGACVDIVLSKARRGDPQ